MAYLFFNWRFVPLNPLHLFCPSQPPQEKELFDKGNGKGKSVSQDLVKYMGSGPVCLDQAEGIFLLPFLFGETKSDVTLLKATFTRYINVSK